MQPGKSVAIVGIGGIFPRSPSLQQFWANICENLNAARRPPAGRWLLPVDEVYDPTVGAADKVYSDRACFVEQPLEALCLDGLNIAGDLLHRLDPMFHLLLHAGRQAYLDGGAPAGDRAGVILGNLCLPSEKSSALARSYLGATFEEQVFGRRMTPAESDVDPINRYVAGLPAGVLAKSLGLQGTCFTLDAACASSLYALKLAVDELVAGRADAMLAGGLSRPDSLYTQMGFSQLRALSPTGTCSPFDENGNGLVVGEGCGMFLLKRTEDAIRDGNRIYAVIRGVGLSNDLGGSLLAPATEGQLRAMRAAYRQAGWAPDDVDLVECHATGTPIGDAVEFNSLQSLWGNDGWRKGQCVIGSVKSNIGHLLTAAGAAALMKTLLAMREQTLPPTANFRRPAAGIDFQSSPFRVLTSAQPWEPRAPDKPRRAAVSAFGFGGINAHLLIEEWQPGKQAKGSVTFPPSFQRPNRPVAIVGLGAEFGSWAGLEEFQYRVLGNQAEVPPQPPACWWGAERSRWFEEAGLDQVSFKGHFIKEVTAAPGRFRIPPRELEEMLPRQLLMLKVAEQALGDAGLNKEDLLFTGVFLGTGLDLNATNFSFRWSLQERVIVWAAQLGLELTERQLAEWLADLREAAGPALTANRVMGALGSIVASRVAKEFRIGGPSFTVSGEENSGLRALEVGLRALQEGSINRALVGAVDMAGDLRSVLGRHAVVPYSSLGRAAPFDKQSDGGIIGEGAAAVILKRLEDARQDGDRIYAVIRGLGSAAGGPGEQSIADREVYDLALSRTFQNTSIKPREVGYLETEGCGQPQIDRMEADALGDLFGAEPNDLPCYIGSVKADIGHAGAAAGLASLVKATLCLDRQIIPRLRNVTAPRYEWVRGKRDFILPAASQYWLRNRIDGPRKALVSSLAVDGSCCHALLEEYADKQIRQNSAMMVRPLGPRREALFCLEADDVGGLLEKAASLQRFVEETGQMDIESLAASWLQAVPPEPGRKSCVSMIADHRDSLLRQLRQVVHSLEENPQRSFGVHGGTEQPPGLRDKVFYAPRPLGEEGRVAFIFPGSGNHFAGMGRELSVQWPQVFRSQDAENQELARQFLPKHFWKQTLADSLHGDHNALVIGQVALGTAVSDLVRSFGIQPDVVSGYSLGESAGLFSLRAWSDRDEMLRRLESSPLFVDELAGACRAAARTWGLPKNMPVDWALGLIDVPAVKVKQALQGLEKVYLLIVNTYAECVVGGDRRQLEELVTGLGCHFLPLKGVTTVHCEVVKPVSEAYRDLHLFPATQPADVVFYSSARGEPYQVTEASAADVILEQALATVDYTRVVEKLYADGVRIFLEMGPGGSCSRMIDSILGDRPHLARTACSAGVEPVSLLLRFLGQCLAERVPVDLNALYPAELVTAREELSVATIGTAIGGTCFPQVGLPQPAAEVPTVEDGAAPRPVPPEKPPAAARPEPIVATEGMTADPVISCFEQLQRESLEAHAAYLDFSASLGQAISANMALQTELLEKMLAAGERLPLASALTKKATGVEGAQSPRPELSAAGAAIGEPAQQAGSTPVLDRNMCLEFAVGSIAAVLGPEFASIDRHPTRVRLPDEPLMLVDRIIEVEGEPRSLTSGRVVTEHDVTADRWYLDGGRIPTCIAVEAGQADLFLSGYLGIDFVTRGLAVYRLLDAVVTFHRSLPMAGDVIRYDIQIDQFFRQDQTYLFRFHFEATVNGKPLLSMKNGCAGFFTADELAAGRGIVHTKLDLQPLAGTLPEDWRELVPMRKEAYRDDQIAALYEGDLAACFGPAFGGLPLQRPYTLPGGRLKLVDRVVELDPTGGRYGLGLIRAEMDIHPEDWFLTCHFCDDNVMPGTLMYECCMHTLRIFLLRMGWVGEQGETWCEPVPGVDSGLKCRGQVIDTTRKVTYEVSIKELGYRPEPFAIVDALMYADGKPIVAIPDMSVRLAGLDRQKVENLWEGQQNTDIGKRLPRPASRVPRPVLYDYDKILAFSDGNPSAAFGEPYRIFDRERKIARLPRPPFQFLDRIVAVTGQAFELAAGAICVAEYDVPPDAWYFAAERAPQMPFAVLLEAGLQPCGWLAAYLGSALTSDTDLKFRNLDGNAVQHRPVTPDSGTLVTEAKITRVSRSGGMIIQAYDFAISDGQGPVYAGDTVFGFFSEESLAQQVGVRQAALYEPSPAELSRARRFGYPIEAPFPADRLRMIDAIDLFVPDGGPQQLGFIRGSKQVDPAEWFFAAHFYQDPVCPGSLGLESLLQLLKVVAYERWGGSRESRFECIALGANHRWNYRGQIVPANDRVVVEATITAVDEDQRLLRADGYLAVDGRVIYQMKDFAVRLL